MLLISTRQKINLKLSSLAQFVFVSKCSFFAFTILSECTRMLRLFVKITKKSCGGGCPQTPLQGFGMQTFSPPSNKFHQPPLKRSVLMYCRISLNRPRVVARGPHIRCGLSFLCQNVHDDSEIRKMQKNRYSMCELGLIIWPITEPFEVWNSCGHASVSSETKYQLVRFKCAHCS